MQLSAVRRGNIPLAMSDHTLLLGWNRQAPLLLRHMATNCHGDSRVLGRWAGTSHVRLALAHPPAETCLCPAFSLLEQRA